MEFFKKVANSKFQFKKNVTNNGCRDFRLLKNLKTVKNFQICKIFWILSKGRKPLKTSKFANLRFNQITKKR